MDQQNQSKKRGKKNSKITTNKYYRYLLFTRKNVSNILHKGCKLFQQWVVDQYLKVEAERFRFLRSKKQQEKFRISQRKGLIDAISQNKKLSKIGKKSIFLPESFVGGPRYMYKKFLDSAAIVTKFGKPSLFITFTCNKNWPEIVEAKKTHQEAWDRPEIVNRIFHMKLNQLMQDITKKKIFGPVAAWMYTTEFQKRDLPHAHILIILKDRTLIDDRENWDKISVATIPDPKTHSKLHSIIKTFNIHSCKKGRCLVKNKFELTRGLEFLDIFKFFLYS